MNLENCNCLNDICRQEFGKANYTNREKVKKLLLAEGINWEEWLAQKKKKEERVCLNCGKDITEKEKGVRFCSKSCAAKYNNSHRGVSEETRKKISEALQKRNPNFDGEIKPIQERNKIKSSKEERYCACCGNVLNSNQVKYCSFECQHMHQQKEYLDRWKAGLENGLKGEYQLSRYIRNYLLDKHNYKCELCGWGERNPYTDTIPLEIHHKDGNYLNNKEENLQVLCPNCHSLTETHKSHNKEGRKGRKKYYKDEEK